MPSLGNDLAIIRKGRGLTLDEIHQSTKIPKSVLISIENDSLFQDMAGNVTYVRSYVRSYAKELSIQDRDIVYALNKIEKGQYKGSLIADDQRPGKEEPDSKGKQPPAPDASQAEDDFGEEVSDEELRQPTESSNPISKSREVESVDWVDLGYQFQPSKRLRSNRLIIVLFIFLLIAIAGFLAYWFYFRAAEPATGNLSGETVPTETTTPPDSLQLGADPLATNDTSALMADGSEPRANLPDTLSIVLYAAYGKLQPVRVYTDIAGQLNPYWIKQGEANKFHFVNEFQLRNGLENIVLLMNGHVVPDFQKKFLNSQTGRIEINRSFFAQSDKWLQPPPDTLPIKAPPPSVIHQIEN